MVKRKQDEDEILRDGESIRFRMMDHAPDSVGHAIARTLAAQRRDGTPFEQASTSCPNPGTNLVASVGGAAEGGGTTQRPAKVPTREELEVIRQEELVRMSTAWMAKPEIAE